MLDLKPSNIFFSQNQISATFGKWNRHKNTSIGETLDDLCDGRCRVSDIETIKVVKRDGKWVTLDNRRLWIFHHLEGAGKCTTIPVIEVQYCSFSHGRKFDSTNGGRSVKFIKGRSPGGKWYRRITPVIPTQVTQDDITKKENEVKSSVELVKCSDELEKMNANTNNHVTLTSVSRVLTVKEQPVSAFKTSGKEEKYQLRLSDETCLNGKVKTEEKFSVEYKGNAITQLSIKPAWKQTRLFNNSKLNRTSLWISSTRSFNTVKYKTLVHFNSLDYGERNAKRNAKHKALYRFKPYNFTTKHFNRIHFDLANTYNIKYPYQTYGRELIPWYINKNDSDNPDKGNGEIDYFQGIESENDWSDDDFSMFVDERENSDYEDVQMSASDDDSKEIDYGDDPWSDADEAYDDDDRGIVDGDDDDNDDEEEENDKENKERKEEEEKDEEKKDKLKPFETSKHGTLPDPVKTISDLDNNDDEMTRKLQHIWSGRPLADIYSFDFNPLTNSKSKEINRDKQYDLPNGFISPDNTKCRWLYTLQLGKAKMKNISSSNQNGSDFENKFTQGSGSGYAEYKQSACINDDSEEVNNNFHSSDNDYNAYDDNVQNIDGDFSGEIRSDLEYDELDVWPDEFDEKSRYKTLNKSDSSDSEDDFLVVKEVEICEKLMDKLVENSLLSLSESSDESSICSDTDDEETYKLNIHFNCIDKYERRQRATKVSIKRYGYDIFQSDPI